MNLNEFYSEFNLVYNNLASNQAAGLDKYEIGVYLTKSQEAITDALYAEFEKSEEARRKLANLVKTAKLKPISVPNNEIIYPEYTITYDLNHDINGTAISVRYIINEQLKMSMKADICIRGKHIDIKPCTHDEIDSYIKNPFRFNNRRALRLDTSLRNNITPQYIEILVKGKPEDYSNIDYYQIRYIENPAPIILEDMTGTDDYINGIQTQSEASLPSTTHRQIVEIAAKMAYQDYKN